MAYNAGEVHSSLHLDRSPFQRSLAAARAAAMEFSRKRWTATISAQITPFQRNAAAVEQRAQRINRMNPNVDVSADIRQALAGLQTVRSAANRASRPVVVQATARVNAALRKVSQLDAAGDNASRDIIIPALAQTNEALRKLLELNETADDASRAVLVPAIARTTEAVRKLMDLNAAADMASRDVTVEATAGISPAMTSLGALNAAKRRTESPVITEAYAMTGAAQARLSALNQTADNASRAIFIPAVARTQGAINNIARLNAIADDASRGININAHAHTGQARSELAGFNATIRRYSRSWGTQGVRARVQADTAQAQAQLRNLERLLSTLEQGETRVRVEAETLRAKGQLRALQAVAASLGMQSPTINTGVRGAAASAATMMGLYTLADKLDGYNVNIGANVDRTLSKALPNMLGALEQQLARFQTFSTAVAAVSVPIMYTAFATLPAVISTAAAAVGSLAIAVGQGLAGAAGTAATALVQGLAGGISQVGLAAGLGGAAIVGYGMAVRRTVSALAGYAGTINDQVEATKKAAKATKEAAKQLKNSRRGTEAHRRATTRLAIAKEDERYQQERLNALYDIATPRLLRLQQRINDARIGMVYFGGAIMHEVAPALTTALNRFERFSDGLQRGALALTRDMTKVSQALIKTATSGQNLKSLTTIFQGIRRAGEPALRAVGNAAIMLVNVIAPLVPHSLRLLQSLSRLTTQARKWSETARGQQRIAEVWALLVRQGERLAKVGWNLAVILFRVFAPATKHAEGFLKYLVRITNQGKAWASSARGQQRIAEVWAVLIQRARWLWRVAQNLSGALWGVMAALNQSGLVQYMANRVEVLSGKLAGLMSSSGKGRRGIVQFGRKVVPILAAAEGLAVDLGKGFVNLTRFVVNFRNKTTGKPVMVEIINAFRYMVNKLIPFLRHEFKLIGPLMPPLIKALTDWFVIFGRAQPEMIFFIKFLTRVLKKFNQLPEPMKLLIARTFAWAAALKVLGVGGLLRLGLIMLGWRRINGQISAAIAQIKIMNGLLMKSVPIKPVVATGPGRVRQQAGKLARFKAAVVGIAGALIVLTIVATYDYEKSAKQYRKARRHGKTQGLSVFQAFIEGMKSVPILGRFFKWYDKEFGKRLGKKDRFKDQSNTAGAAIAEGIIAGFKQVPIIGPLMGGLLDGILKWWGVKGGKDSNKMTPVGRGIISGLLNAMTSFPIIGPIIKFFRDNWDRIKKWWGVESPSRRAAVLGRDIIDGLLLGISKSKIGGILRFFVNMWLAVRKWWGANSPARRAITLGREIAQGLINGLVNWLRGRWSAFVQWGQQTIAAFNRWRRNKTRQLATWASGMLAAFNRWRRNKTRQLVSWASGMLAAFNRWRRNKTQQLVSWASGMLAALNRWRRNKTQQLVSWASGMLAAFNRWRRNKTQQLVTWASGMLAAFNRWRRNKTQQFVSWASGMLAAFNRWRRRKTGQLVAWASGMLASFNRWRRRKTGQLVSWASGMLAAFNRWRRNKTQQLVTWASGMLAAFNRWRRNKTQQLVQWASGLLAAFNRWRRNKTQQLVSWASGMLAAFNRWRRSKTQALVSWASGILSSFNRWRRSKTQALMSWASGMLASLNRWTRGKVNALMSWAQGILAAFNRWRRGKTDALKSWFETMKNRAQGVFKGGWVQVGKDIVGGIVKGISQKARDLYKGARKLAGRALKAARKRLKSKSPSLEFMYLGMDIGRGLEKGIDNMLPAVDRASRRLAQASLFEAQSPHLRSPGIPNAARNRPGGHAAGGVTNNYGGGVTLAPTFGAGVTEEEVVATARKMFRQYEEERARKARNAVGPSRGGIR